jgi:hypothetical protein
MTTWDPKKVIEIKPGEIIYLQGTTQPYKTLLTTFIVPIEEEYDANADPCNKSGIGNG